jgi:hypothetical protein
MPFIETPDDIAERLADKLGIYGGHGDGDGAADCRCRDCFVPELVDRMRASVDNERRLDAGRRAEHVRAILSDAVAEEKERDAAVATLARLRAWADHEATAHQRPGEYAAGFVAAARHVLAILDGADAKGGG